MKRVNELLPLLALLSPAVTSCAGGSAEPEKPNIIFIMSDDHTTQGIGAYGGRLAKLNPTPNIDRIGNEGVIMDRAFCTNGISTPSRANIVSGQYSQTNTVLDLADKLPQEHQLLPIAMRELGYQTAIVGKWHLGNQPEEYDYYNVFYGQGSYFDPVLVEKGSKETVMTKTDVKDPMAEVLGHQYKGHSSDIVMDITLDWLKNKRDKSKPFLLCHHFKAPHDMFEFNPRYADYLEDTFIPEPESLWDNKNNGSVATRGENDELTWKIGASVGKRNTIRNMGQHMDIDPNLPDDEYKRAAYQEFLKRYLRCVKGVDDNVGRLFDYLEKEGLMDNTIIMYTGDQGFFLGEHDYFDKRWMYEEGMRMPFMVRYPPMIKPGWHSGAIVNNVDYAATIIDMAGGKSPEAMQGDSFKSILYTGKEPEGWKQSTYYRYWMHMAHRLGNPAHFGVRTKDYKLIFFYGCNYKNAPANTPPAWELYDLKADPHEMNNVYGQSEYAEVTKSLKAELLRLREKYNETDAGYPHIQKIIDENWNKGDL